MANLDPQTGKTTEMLIVDELKKMNATFHSMLVTLQAIQGEIHQIKARVH